MQTQFFASAVRMLALALLISLVTSIAYGENKKQKTAPNSPPPEKPATGSLFSNGAKYVDMVTDYSPHTIGDIVFIDVIESSAASVSSSAGYSRDSGTLAGVGVAAAPIPDVGVAAAGAITGALSKRKFDGKGATERSSKLKARIAARVVEVMPNGDLRIEAQKQIKINKETEKLKLQGVVRQRDVSLDNIIPSTSVADLNVELNGKGVASAGNGPGWLIRFFDKISPF